MLLLLFRVAASRPAGCTHGASLKARAGQGRRSLSMEPHSQSLPIVAGHHHRAQPGIGCPGLPRASRARDARPRCRSAALDDDQRAAGDGGQWRERLGV